MSACCVICGRDRMRDPSAGGCGCVFVDAASDLIGALEAARHAAIDRRHRRATRLSLLVDGVLAAAGVGALALALLAGWAYLAG